MKVLINLSNHLSGEFTKEQKKFNELKYDQVIDHPFPQIYKTYHEEAFLTVAKSSVTVTSDIITNLLETFKYPEDIYVDVMICGEWGMTYLLVNEHKELQKYFQKAQYNRVYMDVVYPSSERIILERDGKTTHVFQFDRYRRYM